MAVNVEGKITLKADGGDAAAATIEKATKAIRNLSTQHKQAKAVVESPMDIIGYRLLSNAMQDATGASGEMTYAVRSGIYVIQDFAASAMGMASVLGLVGAGIAVGVELWGAWKEHQATASKATKDMTEKLRALNEQFQSGMAKGNIGLTSAQVEANRNNMNKLAELQKAAIDKQRTLVIGLQTTETNRIAQIERAERGYAVKRDAVSQKYYDKQRVLRREEIISAQADLDAMRLGHENFLKQIEEQSKSSGGEQKKHMTASARAAEALAGAELATLETNAEFQMRIAKQVSDYKKRMWEEDTAALRQSTENLMTGMMEGMRKGTVDMQKLFGGFVDSIAQEMEKVAASKLVGLMFGVATGGAGGAGTLGLLGSLFGGLTGKQFGGEVPGRPGQAVPIIAHGGERVVNDQGGGGGMRGSPVFNMNFAGGIGGLDAHSIRMVTRQMRRAIISTGEAPLV